jgi:hypothetical protein
MSHLVNFLPEAQEWADHEVHTLSYGEVLLWLWPSLGQHCHCIVPRKISIETGSEKKIDQFFFYTSRKIFSLFTWKKNVHICYIYYAKSR